MKTLTSKKTYKKTEEKIAFGQDFFEGLRASETELSKNKRFYQNKQKGLYLYQANCLEFMDVLIDRYPNGHFDMVKYLEQQNLKVDRNGIKYTIENGYFKMLKYLEQQGYYFDLSKFADSQLGILHKLYRAKFQDNLCMNPYR